MRVILLAAGYGTRLRPLTNAIPKCLVPIRGKPLLQIWLERLNEAGNGPFLINTHYLSKKVESFIKKSPFRNKIDLVYEEVLLGTAGTLKRNMNFSRGEDVMLIHADNYSLADFRSFIDAHHQRPSECIMTMMTFRTTDPSSCGIVELNNEGIVVGFHEKVKTPPGNLANGAVYILSKELLSRMINEFPAATDFSTEILGQLAGKIFTYETTELFMDIGTPEAYSLANKL